jgi:nitrite reductase (NO-forming)
MAEPQNPYDARAKGGDREGLWWVAATSIAVLALVFAVIGVFTPSKDSGASTVTPAAPGGASATTATDAAGVTGAAATFDIELGDLFVKPASIQVAAGTPVRLNVRNTSTAMSHDLKLNGTQGTALLAPGATESIDLGPFDASAEAWCTVPGHKAAGMVLMIDVTGGAPTSASAAPGTTAAGTGDAKLDPTAEPSATWQARDPKLPAALTGTVHEIALDATEEVMEVAPGVTQQMWTFNGQVPGPIIRVKLGDVVRVTLTNKGSIGHSIDFHASKVAWNDEMRTIKPGESLVYEFHADYAGFFMYHCGTAPTLHHIGNGMYGGIIVDPPDLAPVDQEFFMVQSEMYYGPQGQPGDLTKMQNDAWDAVVFNGYHSQYKHAPIHVEANKRYRVWVLDDGPSENSAFHIVGTIFDTVFKEGSYLLRPDQRQGGSQVLDLQPAQGGFVELTFAEDGLYPFVSHKFSNPGKGALGFFAVGAADTSALGSH